MDEEMDDFYRVEAASLVEYDPNYEFDAPRYYDFCRMETDWDVEEAERWFDAARTYPPSPFLAKMNWGKGLYSGHPNMYIEEENHGQMNSTSINRDCSRGTDIPTSVQYNGVEETRMLPKKSAVEPSLTRISTLMKPTISHMAKQRTCQEVQFSRFLRSKIFPVKDQETASQHSSIFESYATKRQKLEAGYLRKAADLKHRAVLQHKLAKKVGENIDLPHTTLKVTVPREPHLETACRALMHRSKHNGEPTECTKSNLYSSKVQNLNPKTQVCCPKQVTARPAEFQVPCQPNNKSFRSMSDEATKLKKCQMKHKPGAHPPDKELNLSTSKHDATISLFQKLTLGTEARRKLESQSKCLKENAPFTQPVQEEVKVTLRKGNLSIVAGKQLLQGKCRNSTQISKRTEQRIEKLIFFYQ